LKFEYGIRPYHPGDEEEIVELLELVFDGWPNFDLKCSALEHWRWKYLENPLKTSFIALGVSDNKIIGANHSTPFRIKIGQSIYLGSYGSDAAVHPDFRGIGVKTKTQELKGEMRRPSGTTLAFSVSSNPIIIKSKLRRGRPRFPHPVTVLVRIRDIDRQIDAMPIENAWFYKLGFRATKLFNDIKYASGVSDEVEKEIRIREIHAFDEKIDHFWEEVSKHYDFILERNRSYLNWRYCDTRAGDFIIKQAENDRGEILGYIVVKINRYRKEYPIGYVVDLLTLPNQLEVARVLTDDAVNLFDSMDVNIVSLLVPKHHPHEEVLKRFGFLDSRKKLQLFYRPLDKVDVLEQLESVSAEKIHFSYGDIDSLPVSMPNYR